MQSRRSFFAGAGALLIASPAIVRASSLMPIKSYLSDDWAAYLWLKEEVERNLLELLRNPFPIGYNELGFAKVYGSVNDTLIHFDVPLQ